MLRESGAPVSGIFHGFDGIAITQSARGAMGDRAEPQAGKFSARSIVSRGASHGSGFRWSLPELCRSLSCPRPRKSLP